MQIRENTEVVDAEGKSLGSVDRVVIDPGTREVTHLVTKKGLLFTREKVIPLDHLNQVDAHRITLKDNVDPDNLPDFVEEHHIPMKEPGDMPGGNAREVMWYPRVGLHTGAGMYMPYGAPSYFIRTRQNIPDGAIVLEEGAKVICRDGEKAGKVERLYTEPQEERVTHLMISEGFISKERKLIPCSWVKGIDEDTVELSVTCDIVDGLPPYSE
jgi:hypothetical protein